MTDTCPVCNGPIAPTDDTCPSCGFKLQGTTQGFEPIVVDDDGQASAPAVKPRTPMRASLTVVRGPQIGTVYELDSRIQTIGRSPQCDIFLNDMTVSREHAQVIPVAEGFSLKDLQSYNGIWINNSNVEEAHLTQDDIVQIGAFCLLYAE